MRGHRTREQLEGQDEGPHLKPLSENVTQAAILVNGDGRRYAPIAWQGDALGGRHCKGVLQFSLAAA